MADNFNLRAFLSENKLTKNAQLLKESTVLNGKSVDLTSIEVDGNYPSDVYIVSADFEDKTPLSDEEIQQLEKDYPNLAGEVGFDKQTSGFDHDEDYGVEEAKDGTWKKGDFYSRDYVEQTYPDKVKEIEGNIEDEEDRNPNIWDLYTSLETPEEVEDFVKDYINETTNTMTTREQKLVEMVQDALGHPRTGLPHQDPTYTTQEVNTPEGEDIVEEKPLPQYESVEDLMKEIEHGTNKAMYEYKISEMKRIAKQLEEKVTTLEESEHAAHINPADVKKMKKDILTLHKGVAKIEKEYDRKFNTKTKTSEPKKEEAEKESVTLAEGFDLKKFLVENKLTASSRSIEESAE